jgi:hypothetical protein
MTPLARHLATTPSMNRTYWILALIAALRWFDLRDHNTSGPNFQQHYGLLRDDYSPKPAYGVYRDLVRRFSR